MTGLKHALLDWDVFAKTKMQDMCCEFGQLSRLWFVDLVLAMSQATSGSLSQKLALKLARDVGISEPEKLLQYAIEAGIFILGRDGSISNERVLQDKTKLQIKRDQQNKRKRKERDNSVTHSVTPVTDTVYEDLKKEGGPGETTEPEPLDAKNLPAEFQNPKLLAAWGRYRHARLKRWRRDYDRIQFEADGCKYSGRVDDFIRDLNAAASGAWANVRDASGPEPAKKEPKRPRPPEFKLPERAKVEALSQTLTDDQRAALTKLKGAA